MNERSKADQKLQLFNTCKKILEDRIAVCRRAIDNAQAAANEEEKSSAGDKYETGRAMSHLEKDMFEKQLASNKNELTELLSLDCTKHYATAMPGAVIKCPEYSFFIAAGLGKISFENETVYLLSPKAPLAHVLIQKNKGDTFLFNNNELEITDIF